jgi:uncharacterized delta-60 repeat protein
LAHAVTIQSDGKIVAAGAAASGTAASVLFNFALARYNSNGTLDLTFGTSGKVTTDFAGASDTANDVAVQLDGKIIAVGQATINGLTDGAFGLACYNVDGTLDATFGTGGKVTTNFGPGPDQIGQLVLQQDGKILAAGGAEINGTSKSVLARYLNDTSSPTSTPSPTPTPTPTPLPTPSPTPAPTPRATTVQLSAAAYSANEGDKKIVVTVTRTGIIATAASVNYSTINLNGSSPCRRITGAASPRCDYIQTAGTLEFAPDETSKNISVLLVDDAYVEGNETFPLRLSLPAGADLGEPNEATLTINDNDLANNPMT